MSRGGNAAFETATGRGTYQETESYQGGRSSNKAEAVGSNSERKSKLPAVNSTEKNAEAVSTRIWRYNSVGLCFNGIGKIKLNVEEITKNQTRLQIFEPLDQRIIRFFRAKAADLVEAEDWVNAEKVLKEFTGKLQSLVTIGSAFIHSEEYRIWIIVLASVWCQLGEYQAVYQTLNFPGHPGKGFCVPMFHLKAFALLRIQNEGWNTIAGIAKAAFVAEEEDEASAESIRLLSYILTASGQTVEAEFYKSLLESCTSGRKLGPSETIVVIKSTCHRCNREHFDRAGCSNCKHTFMQCPACRHEKLREPWPWTW